jgi:DNA-binding response OmpR family regulator
MPHLLLFEDDELLRDALQPLLSQAGFSVLGVADGALAPCSRTDCACA